MKYRELKAPDKDWVIKLWAKNKGILGSPLPVYQYLKQKAVNEIFLVIPETAFIHYRVKQDGESVIYNIAVDPAHKGKGIGKFLVGLLKPPIILKTDKDNEESNAFYRKLGFICLGHKPTKSGKIVNIYKRYI